MILYENGFHNPVSIFAAAQRTMCRNRRFANEGSGAEAPVALASTNGPWRRSLPGRTFTEQSSKIGTMDFRSKPRALKMLHDLRKAAPWLASFALSLMVGIGAARAARHCRALCRGWISAIETGFFC
jgi:hypothetical protein